MKEESQHFIPIGPFDDLMIKDEFSFEDVRTVHCVASVSRNICSHLIRKAEQENKRYLTICIPAYNEEFEEMLKTLISLMENIEFMKKKASQYKEFLDVDGVVEEFKNTIPVIVPIFDGTKALSKSMSAWLEEKFPHLLDDLKPSPAGVKPELDSTDVRIVCSKWWYLCDYEEREAQQKRAREGKNVATGNAAVDDMLKSILLKYEEHRQARKGNHDPQFIPSNHVFLEHEREEFEKQLAKSASNSSNHAKPTSTKTAPLTPQKSEKADDFQGDDLNMSTTTFNDSFEETKEDSYDAIETLSGLKVRGSLFKSGFSSDRLSDNLTPRSTSEKKTPTQTIRIPLADFQTDSYVDAETLLGFETGSSSGSEHSADLDRVMHDIIRSGSKLSLQSHLLSVSPINEEARQHLNAHEEEGSFLSPEFLQGSVSGDNHVTSIKNKFGVEIPSDSDRIIQFYLCPIVKRSNHRKHNSHQWFFDAICDGLEDKTIYALLTDCGTSYAETCVGRLMVELYRMPDLIGVTARQRVETPNRYFHPCLDAPYAWMQGEHAMGSPACWKCWLTYLLSPCPLQGIEFEGSVTISLAMFNLVEALPVMPGPCQLMHWQKMKEFHVVDEYFNLLFEGENEKIELPELPPSLIKMKTSSTEYSGIEEGRGIDLTTTTAVKDCPTVQLPEASKATMTFAEFLRTNMRLAEDRILTFVSVFSTGYGTKWVLGSTFYYQPEIQWNTLLTQRRRWTNGTFAGFLFSFVSPRAKQRILGGMFDAHKPGKSIKAVYILWSLQVIILCYLFFSPAVFGAGSYKSLVILAYSWPEAFHWAVLPVISDEIRVAEVLVVLYLVIYAGWSIASFYAPRGKISEWICQTLAIYCAISVLPMYISIWRTIVVSGVNVIGALVLINLFIPVLISIGEDIKSAVLYLLYLPWLLSLVMFFIVFFPSYSFARLWDTTWGNRAGGKDSAVNDSMESYLKSKNFQFILLLIGINIALTKAFVEIFSLGYAAIITFMMVAFFPMLIQIIGSSVFLFIIWPLRKYIMKPFSKEEMERKEEEEKEKKREEEEEKKRLEERRLALSSSSLSPSSSSLRLTSVTLSSPSRELDLFTARYNEDDVVDAIFPRLSKA